MHLSSGSSEDNEVVPKFSVLKAMAEPLVERFIRAEVFGFVQYSLDGE